MASSPAQDTSAIERLVESVVDGRTENVRYRQDQLQSLHGALRDGAAGICAAIAGDTAWPAAEVEAEFYLALEAVRHFYDTLDFKRELEHEYSIAHGRDNAGRRVGAGLVVIRPTNRTRLYSVISPLAAAIAAGNCVVLVVRLSSICRCRVLLLTVRSSRTCPYK